MSEKNFKLARPKKDPFFGFLTGHALTLRKNRLNYMLECMMKYGDFIEFKIANKIRTIMLTGHEGIEQVMVKKAKIYSKNTPGYKIVSEITGNGVFTDSFDRWQDARKIAMPYFLTSHMENYTRVANKVAKQIVSDLSASNQREINICPYMTKLTLQVLGECIFGQDLGNYSEEIDESLTKMINIKNAQINILFPKFSKSKKMGDRVFNEEKLKLDKIIQLLIDNTKKTSFYDNSLLQALEKSNYANEPYYLIDQVRTFAFAGHETSASVLSWCFDYLKIHQEWQNIIRDEISLHCQNDEITLHDLKKCEVLERFVKEVMRLRPPAWSFGRYCEEEDEIFGEKIKVGDIITISPFLTHHNPRYYKDPFKFNPNNFTRGEIENRPRGAYIPFGIGPRVCLGAELAMIEIQMTIIYFLKNFKITGSHTPAEIDPLISLRAKNGIYIELKR